MLSANLSELAKGRRFISPTGQSYFQAHFNAELSFGTTEMKARITWTGTDVRFLSLLTLNSVGNLIVSFSFHRGQRKSKKFDIFFQ